MKLTGRKSLDIGSDAETLALGFLQGHGLKLVTRNYHCRFGEIDLIMRERSTLVFVEVRFRKHCHYGSAMESVHKSKQKKIIIAAQHYLQNNTQPNAQACRFDVIALSPGNNDQHEIEYNWIKHAFQLDA